MGHIRLGRLPKTYKWRNVFEALESDELNPEIIAKAQALRQLRDRFDRAGEKEAKEKAEQLLESLKKQTI